MTSNNKSSLEDSLVDLYLSIKIRKTEDIEKLTPEDYQCERQNLKRISPVTIIEYIKSTIEILINLKVEEKLLNEKRKLAASESSFNSSLAELIVNNNNFKNNSAYENIIKELDGQLRKMIKNEQYLKIQLDSLKTKYDHLEKKYDELSKAFEMKGAEFKPLITGYSNYSKSKSKTPVRENSKHISNPINYNFNNPILIYGGGKKTEEDTVNYKLNESNEKKPFQHCQSSKYNKFVKLDNKDTSYITHRMNKQKFDASPLRNRTPIITRNQYNLNMQKAERNRTPVQTTRHYNQTTLCDISTLSNNRTERNLYDKERKYYNAMTTLNNPKAQPSHSKSKIVKDSFTKKQIEIQSGLKKLSKASILNNISNLQKTIKQPSKDLSNNHYRSGSLLFKP